MLKMYYKQSSIYISLLHLIILTLSDSVADSFSMLRLPISELNLSTALVETFEMGDDCNADWSSL